MKRLHLKTSVGTLAANLYLPEGIKNPPLVIVTGAWTTVKEQMPDVYAKGLLAKGFAALTFDFRGWGESPTDDQPFLEDPARKTEDIRAVIEAAKNLDEIDASRIAGLGICASAGYMLDAVSANNTIKAAAVAAVVAPWLHNPAIASGVYGGDSAVKQLIEQAESAEASSEPTLIEAASNTNENALMYQAPYYNESDRGRIPEYDNQFNVASWKGWLTYDAIKGAERQDKHVLMVASEAMALPQGAKAYLAKARNNVDSVWLDDVTQFDFYDVAEHVDTAINAVAKHLSRHL